MRERTYSGILIHENIVSITLQEFQRLLTSLLVSMFVCVIVNVHCWCVSVCVCVHACVCVGEGESKIQ